MDQKVLRFLHNDDIIKGSDYNKLMKSFTGYKKEGANKYDDAPDSMTILVEFINDIGLHKAMNKMTVDKKPVA